MPIDFSSIAREAQNKVQDSGLKPYLLPAAVGALAGGPLMAYMAGKKHDPEEAPSQRRHRILRNALMGLTLGGAAGGALPAGANMLWNSQVAPMAGFHPVDAAANTMARHALPTAAAGAGGLAAWHNLVSNRGNASQGIAEVVHPGETQSSGTGHTFNRQEMPFMSGLRGPDQQGHITHLTDALAQRAGDPLGLNDYTTRWGAHELAGEAGVHVPTISEMAKNPDLERVAAGMKQSLPEHLRQQGLVSKLMASTIKPLTDAKASLSESASPLAKLVARILPEGHVPAELYSRYMRPSAGAAMRTVGHMRLGALPAAGLVGAGVLGANYVQNKLEGN